MCPPPVVADPEELVLMDHGAEFAGRRRLPALDSGLQATAGGVPCLAPGVQCCQGAPQKVRCGPATVLQLRLPSLISFPAPAFSKAFIANQFQRTVLRVSPWMFEMCTSLLPGWAGDL